MQPFAVGDAEKKQMMMSVLLGTADAYESYQDQTADSEVTQTFFHPQSKLNDTAMYEYGLKNRQT